MNILAQLIVGFDFALPYLLRATIVLSPEY